LYCCGLVTPTGFEPVLPP